MKNRASVEAQHRAERKYRATSAARATAQAYAKRWYEQHREEVQAHRKTAAAKAYRHQWYETHKQQICQKQQTRTASIRAIVQAEKVRRGCEVCGYNKCVDALDFHHDHEKSFVLASCHRFPLEKVQQEMQKCVVVCANCHREIHSKRV